MMSRKTISLTLAFAAGAMAIAAHAQADSAAGCYGGYYTNVEILEIAENHVLVNSNAFGTGYVLDDRSGPLHGMYGPCMGSIEIKDGAPISANIQCVRTDKDGDKVRITGAFDTPSNGAWKLEGLTGKFVDAKGSGTWGIDIESESHYFACFDGEYKLASDVSG